MAAKRNKDSIHATVSPYLKKQAEALVETEEFSSMSDLVSIALAEFIGKYDREKKEKPAATYAQSHDDILPKYTPEKKEKAAATVANGTYPFDIQ